jgi:NAD(P)H-nitrite reductase large subunit
VLASPEMDDDSRQPLHPVIQGLKTVCRCNNIKYRTIERAIREGATTLHQVATRTTATTGHCGGSCTPEVQEMIADLAPKRPVAQPPAPNKSENAEAWWLRKK